MKDFSINDIIQIKRDIRCKSICAQIAIDYNMTGRVVQIDNDYYTVDFNLSQVFYIHKDDAILVISSLDVDKQINSGDF